MLIGNLAADPTVRATGNGVSVCSFRVLTSDSYKDANGNWQERTEGHNIVTFDRLADICGKYLVKGKKVYIEGSIQSRSYDDKDGIKRYVTEIKANEMLMLSGGQGEGGASSYGGGESRGNYGGGNNYGSNAPATRPSAPTPPPSMEDDFGPEDDLPF